MILKNSLIKEVKQVNYFDLNLLNKNELFLKNVGLNSIKENKLKSFLKDLLNEVNTENFKYLSFDIKIKEVKKGQIPAIEGWHRDSTNWNDSNNLDKYYLLTSNENCLTEFLNEEVLLKSEEMSINKQLQDFNNQINENKLSTIKVKPWVLYEYDSNCFHRATKALNDHLRLFVRINLSNHLKPSMRIL